MAREAGIVGNVRSPFLIDAFVTHSCVGELCGYSALAEAHPDLVEAYEQEAGRVFAERPTFLGPLLSVSGEYDYVKPETDLFVASLKASGSDPFVLTFRPNWGGRAQKNPIYRHSMPNEYADAVWRWFAGLADMRQQADGGWRSGPERRICGSSRQVARSDSDRPA